MALSSERLSLVNPVSFVEGSSEFVAKGRPASIVALGHRPAAVVSSGAPQCRVGACFSGRRSLSHHSPKMGADVEACI